MRLLTGEEVPAFVAAKPVAVLHFDAEWDAKYREQTRRSMLEAEAALGDRANFAEIDIDANVELAGSIPVLNVPLVAYYRDGQLVAALIGAGQNVRARVERVLRGERIGRKDGTGTEEQRMKVVRWREPAAFKRATRGGGPRWRVGIIIAVGIAALILTARAVVPAPNAPAWPLMALIAVACGLTFGVGLPALTAAFPSEVIVSPKGINRNGVSGTFFSIEFWPWDEVARCAIEPVAAGGRSFQALVLYGPADEPLGAIGLNDRPPVNDLEAYLAERGKPLTRRAG